jgi:hypothetical protein
VSQGAGEIGSVEVGGDEPHSGEEDHKPRQPLPMAALIADCRLLIAHCPVSVMPLFNWKNNEWSTVISEW